MEGKDYENKEVEAWGWLMPIQVAQASHIDQIKKFFAELVTRKTAESRNADLTVKYFIVQRRWIF